MDIDVSSNINQSEVTNYNGELTIYHNGSGYTSSSEGAILELRYSRLANSGNGYAASYLTGLVIYSSSSVKLPNKKTINCSDITSGKSITVGGSNTGAPEFTWFITSIEGLTSGESVQYDGYTYTTDGTTITRSNGGVKYTLTGNSDTNLLTTDGWELADIPITTKN